MSSLGRYEALLDEPDQDLLAWIYGRVPLPARHDHDVFELLRAFEPSGAILLDNEMAIAAPRGAGPPDNASLARDTTAAHAVEGLEAALPRRPAAPWAAATILHVARDGGRMSLLAGMVAFFAPEVEIVEIPAWDCLPYDRISPSAGIMAERLRALARLAAGPADASAWSSPPPMPSCRRCRRPTGCARRICGPGPAPASIATGMIGYLERNGYHRTSAVVEAGDYAVRGGLVDVFPSGEAQPLRLDFFGSTLESIRTFDPLTQRSVAKLSSLDLMPVSEVLLDAEATESFKAGYLQPVRRRHRRPAAGGGRARAERFPGWSTGYPCSIAISCR